MWKCLQPSCRDKLKSKSWCKKTTSSIRGTRTRRSDAAAVERSLVVIWLVPNSGGGLSHQRSGVAVFLGAVVEAEGRSAGIHCVWFCSQARLSSVHHQEIRRYSSADVLGRRLRERVRGGRKTKYLLLSPPSAHSY